MGTPRVTEHLSRDLNRNTAPICYRNPEEGLSSGVSKEESRQLQEKARAWLDSEEGQATLEAGFRQMTTIERPKATVDVSRYLTYFDYVNLSNRISALESRIADLEAKK